MEVGELDAEIEIEIDVRRQLELGVKTHAQELGCSFVSIVSSGEEKNPRFLLSLPWARRRERAVVDHLPKAKGGLASSVCTVYVYIVYSIFMVYGIWYIVYGIWYMVHSTWYVVTW